MFIGTLVVLVLAIVLYRKSIKSGQTYVRAVDYLRMLDAGATCEEANSLSSNLFSTGSDPDINKRAIKTASTFKRTMFDGKQKPLILFAKSKGFSG